MIPFHTKLRALLLIREIKNFEELAAVSGVSIDTIREFNLDGMQVSELRKISTALHVSPCYFVDDPNMVPLPKITVNPERKTTRPRRKSPPKD